MCSLPVLLSLPTRNYHRSLSPFTVFVLASTLICSSPLLVRPPAPPPQVSQGKAISSIYFVLHFPLYSSSLVLAPKTLRRHTNTDKYHTLFLVQAILRPIGSLSSFSMPRIGSPWDLSHQGHPPIILLVGGIWCSVAVKTDRKGIMHQQRACTIVVLDVFFTWFFDFVFCDLILITVLSYSLCTWIQFLFIIS